MRVLMFGWEFPPHISGGLGTACYGLTKGLAESKEIEVTFVVPKAFGDEDKSTINLIGANTIPVSDRTYQFHNSNKTIQYLEVDSQIIPYVSEDEFWKLKSKKYGKGSRFVKTDANSRINFTGLYGPSLIQEIKDYALVARMIAGKHECDIIHAHDWLAYPAGIAAKNVSGKPLVIHVHATEFDRSGGQVNPNVYSIEREGMEMADEVVAVSNLTRDIILEKYGIAPHKVTTVYNAVEPVKTDSSKSFKKGVNEKIVTFLGRITMQKGPEYFLEAASLILKKMQNVRFVMAGAGDMMNEMVDRTAELGISDQFHFTGFLKGNEVQELLSLSDVFVMPSVSEPFGIVPLEAMQLGVPVVISKQSGVAEIIENAIKIDFWDTKAMADAIHGVLNYPSLAQCLTEEGKQEVDGVIWLNSAEHVKMIYKKVLKNY